MMPDLARDCVASVAYLLPVGDASAYSGAITRSTAADEHTAAARFIAAVEAWLAGAASPDLADLSRRTALSRRQVERRCKALFGQPPKLLARRYRALRAAEAIAARAAGADALIADGFCDQSHMIREVKRFTGWTPGQVRRHLSPERPTTLTIAEP